MRERARTLGIVLDEHLDQLLGALAGILKLATNARTPLGESGVLDECTKMVAGVGFEPTTFRL